MVYMWLTFTKKNDTITNTVLSRLISRRILWKKRYNNYMLTENAKDGTIIECRKGHKRNEKLEHKNLI